MTRQLGLTSLDAIVLQLYTSVFNIIVIESLIRGCNTNVSVTCIDSSMLRVFEAFDSNLRTHFIIIDSCLFNHSNCSSYNGSSLLEVVYLLPCHC